MTMTPYQVGQALRAYREHRGWSQRELADVLQVPQSRVSRVEAGASLGAHVLLSGLGADETAKILRFAATCPPEPPPPIRWTE